MPWLWVGAGGALGSILRYLIAVWTTKMLGPLPWGTLSVNLAGSFLLAAFLGWAESGVRSEIRLLVGTGVMGGFTTYSTFNFETLALIESGSRVQAVVYVVGTVLGALVLAGLGLYAGRALGGSS